MSKALSRSALALLALSSSAHALNLQGHQFTDSYRYSLLQDTFSERFAGQNVFTASYSYVHSPFYYTNSGVSTLEDEIINYNHVGTVGYTRYLSNRFALGGEISGVQNKVFNKNYTSFGDTLLRAKWLLWDAPKSWAISLNPYLTLPTGKRENFTTARYIGGGAQLVGELHLSAWHLLGSAGYGHSDGNHFSIVDYRNILLTQLGVSYDISPTWNLNGEMLRNFTLTGSKRQNEGDYFVTAKNKTGETFSLYGGAGVAGTNQVERNNYTLFFGVKFHEAEEKAPAPQAPVARPAPKEEVAQAPVAPPKSRADEKKFGKLMALDDVYFGNNSTSVSAAETKKVLAVVAAYQRLGKKFSRVVLEGYASKRGDHQKNFVLGQGRAAQVAAILVAKGVPAGKIVTVSYGDETKQHPEEWKNRKVQFRVYEEN